MTAQFESGRKALCRLWMICQSQLDQLLLSCIVWVCVRVCVCFMCAHSYVATSGTSQDCGGWSWEACQFCAVFNKLPISLWCAVIIVTLSREVPPSSKPVLQKKWNNLEFKITCPQTEEMLYCRRFVCTEHSEVWLYKTLALVLWNTQIRFKKFLFSRVNWKL